VPNGGQDLIIGMSPADITCIAGLITAMSGFIVALKSRGNKIQQATK